MQMQSSVVRVVCLLIVANCCTNALKCATEDGPSETELRNIVHTCIKRVGNMQMYGNQSNSYNTGYDRDGDTSEFSDSNSNSNTNSNENYGNNQQGNARNRNNDYNNRNSRYKRRSPQKYNNNYDDGSYSTATSSQNRRQHDNGEDQANERDTSCLIHCFFQELHMTGSNGLPEKRKVLNVITKRLRDRELKSFYSDSIQDCFNVLDMDYKRDKCEYSNNLLKCLAERGRANCNDWNEDTFFF